MDKNAAIVLAELRQDHQNMTLMLNLLEKESNLIYADGDDDWRRRQNDTFGEAMDAAGNHTVHVVEVPNRHHGSLMSDMNAPDDEIGDLMLIFIRGHD